MASLYILGGSITGGAGVSNRSDAWPNLVGEHNTIYFKNAVRPGFFLHCFDRFKPTSSGPFRAVVLDFGPNMWDSESVPALASLARKSRIQANTSHVLLVAWPRLHTPDDIRRVSQAARLSNAHVIAPIHKDWMYADAVHPNAVGHRTIATAVRQWLEQPRAATFVRIPPLPSTSRDETCLSDARQIPIVRADAGWSLVDDSRKQGVHKFGWKNGNQPSELHARVDAHTCSSIVTIGYLLTNDAKGWFHIRCVHPCECSTIRGPWQRIISPFPNVSTYTHQKLHVTDTTSFGMIATNRSSCIIRIRGLRSRIDSMYVRATTSDDINNAARSAHAQHRLFVAASRGCRPSRK